MYDESVVEALIVKDWATVVGKEQYETFVDWLFEHAIKAGGFLFGCELENNCQGWFFYSIRQSVAGTSVELHVGRLQYAIPDTSVAGQRKPPARWAHYPVWSLPADLFLRKHDG